MDTLEEDLTCSVCYSLFCDPRVLGCSHTFCKACLESVVQASGGTSIWRPLRLPLKCPNCRALAELPPGGVEALPANVSLRAIVEKFRREPRPRAPACAQHPLQPLNVYCVCDRTPVCGLCLTLGEHRGHRVADPQEACASERGGAAALGRSLAGEWAERAAAAAERAERERGCCTATLREDRLAVQRFFRGLELTLERRRLAWSAALDRAEADLERECRPVLDRLKEMREEQLRLIAEGAAAEGEESPLAYLRRAGAFRERAEALLATPLPQVRALSVRPRAGEVLERQWGGVTLSGLEQCPVPPIACCPEMPRPKDTPPSACPHPGPASLMALLALLAVSLCCLHLAFEGAVGDAALCLHWLAENLQLEARPLLALLSSLRDTAAQRLASISDALFVW